MKVGATSIIDTKDRFWSAATVAAAIDAKKAQRQEKGRASNCFSLRLYDTDAPASTPEEKKFELENFLKILQKSIKDGNFSNDDLSTNRFQLLVQNGAHWTPLDITIKNNKLYVISMDAAASNSEMASLNTIKKYFPDTTFYSLGGECSTQMDNNSCSRFSLDAIFKMQNIDDPISLLENHAAQSSPKSLKNYDTQFTGKEYLLAPKDVPNEMAFLFRNVQSGTALDKLPDRLLDSPINKKKQTLRDYAESHAQMEDVKGEQKKRYKAIETVKTKMTDNTEAHLQSMSEEKKGKLREDSKGIQFITSSQTARAHMNTQQKQAVPQVRQDVTLAKEFVRNTPKKTGLLSYFSTTNKKLQEARKIIKAATADPAGPSSSQKKVKKPN